MASTLTTTKIVDEFGKYYVKEGQNKQRLIRSIVQPAVSLEKNAKKIPTSDTIYRAANYTFESVVRPFKKSFDPTSSITFHPNIIQLRQIKVDAEVYPNDIEESWLGFLANNDCAVKEWPITRFIMEEYLAKQIAADRENKIVYKGVYDSSGTDPEDSMDGIKQVIVSSLSTDYPINVISGIGTLDGDAIFDQIEKFDEALPELYNEQKVVLFMSPKWVRAYKKDKRSQNFFFIQDLKELNESIDFSKHYICPLPSMSGTNDLWATVDGNLVWLTKREGNLANMQVQAHDRCVHIMVDWWEGIGFLCNQVVWATAEMFNATAADTSTDGIIVRNIYPSVKAVTSVADTSAVISGKVLGDVTGATVKLIYKKTAATTWTDATTSLLNGVYSATLATLTASIAYDYRLQVTFGNDNYLSDIGNFTTLATPIP